MDTTKLFANGKYNEFDAVVVDLMEKNKILVEEIKNPKIEQESQAILLCQVTEQKKKTMEEKLSKINRISHATGNNESIHDF